jgi:transcriptional regulatory protein LevR
MYRKGCKVHLHCPIAFIVYKAIETYKEHKEQIITYCTAIIRTAMNGSGTSPKICQLLNLAIDNFQLSNFLLNRSSVCKYS